MLTPEEIEEIRRQEMERLSSEEASREGRVFPPGSTPRMEDKEGDRLTREREARALRKAVEEEFWTARGYKKYLTHNGKELWLTPDEIRERKSRRRGRSKTATRPVEGIVGTLLQKDAVKHVLLYLAVLALGVLLGLQLVR